MGGQIGILGNPKKSTDYYKGGYWTPSVLKMELRASHIAVAFHNLIYIVGGLNKNVVSLNTAEVFNTKIHQFSLIKPMKIGQSKFAAAINDNKFCCFGGLWKIHYDENDPLWLY